VEMGLRLPGSQRYTYTKNIKQFIEKYIPELFNADEQAWSKLQTQPPQPTVTVSCPLQDADFRAALHEWWEARKRRSAGRLPRATPVTTCNPVTVTDCNPVTPVTVPELHAAVTGEGGAPRAIRIAGWTVRKEKSGLYRAFKKINGKTKAFSLGRSLDAAETKIRDHEATLNDDPEY